MYEALRVITLSRRLTQTRKLLWWTPRKLITASDTPGSEVVTNDTDESDEREGKSTLAIATTVSFQFNLRNLNNDSGNNDCRSDSNEIRQLRTTWGLARTRNEDEGYK